MIFVQECKLFQNSPYRRSKETWMTLLKLGRQGAVSFFWVSSIVSCSPVSASQVVGTKAWTELWSNECSNLPSIWAPLLSKVACQMQQEFHPQYWNIYILQPPENFSSTWCTDTCATSRKKVIILICWSMLDSLKISVAIHRDIYINQLSVAT